MYLGLRAWVLICVVLSVTHVPSRLVAQTETISRSAIFSLPSSSESGVITLPKSCGGGLPPGASVPACCMFGYVFIGGRAVEGAHVTISGSRGSVETWTERGPDSPLPYYRTSLSDAPLSAEVGESITIVAEYSTHIRTTTHKVLSGGQQVDIILPRVQTDDYVFDRQLARQNIAGVVNHAFDLAVDAAGNFYVTDSGNARIQVFNKNRQFLYQWGTIGNQPGQFSNEQQSIAVSKSGDVYVIDKRLNRVQRFTSNGTFVQMWGELGDNDGQFRFPAGVAVDASGNVYIADSDNHRIQKFNRTGTFLMKWGHFGNADGEFNSPVDVTIDDKGYIYVVDLRNHRIQKFTGSGIYVDQWGGEGQDNGRFSFPGGVVTDKGGDVYVADSWNHRVQKFDEDGRWIRTWGSFGHDNGYLSSPHGIVIDDGGNVQVADWLNNRLQIFTSDGYWLKNWANGGVANEQFLHPSSIVFDRNGNYYVTDTLNNRIQKFNANGTYLTQWGGYGDTDGKFNNPWGIAIDVSGNVYVVDTENHRVQKFNSNGVYLTKWGDRGDGNGQFAYPRGVAVDKNGNVYVVDTDNHRIQKFTSSGGYIIQWGGLGIDNGKFARPHGIALDDSGNIYIADRDNSRVQKFSNTGLYLFQWGSGGFENGRFTRPEGIAVDQNGSIYVADTWNHRIQKFTENGGWVGTWGKEGAAVGQFTFPTGIAIDVNNAMFVADSVNNRVQIFHPLLASPPVATINSVETQTIVKGQSVTLVGVGTAEHPRTISAYEWRLDGSPTPFATSASASLSTANLSLGRHTVTFRVRDSAGVFSASQSLGIDVVSPTPATRASWTFLLYLAGDNDGASFLNAATSLGALYRLIRSGPNPNVTVVALFDGFRAGGGDTTRFVLRPDGTSSQESLGEVNMGDPQTLAAFAQWGMQQFPADHYYLSLADHANALDGIAWDYTSGLNEHLTNTELRQALVAITESGAHPLDVLHLDGCLMGLLEIAYQVRGQARYLVASEHLAWSAFAYDSYRAAVGPNTSAVTLATAVADQYAQQVSGLRLPYTVSVLDLGQVDQVERATDALAQELLRYALAQSANRTTLAGLREQVQTFDANGDLQLTTTDDYVDLADWVRLVEGGVNDAGVRQAAGRVRQALRPFVVRERHASGAHRGNVIELERAGGVGIYYPWQPSARVYQDYVRGGLTFPTDTWWDEYLAAGLSVRTLDVTVPHAMPVAPLPLKPFHHVLLPVVRR